MSTEELRASDLTLLAYFGIETEHGPVVYDVIRLGESDAKTISARESTELVEMLQNTVDALQAINEELKKDPPARSQTA